MAGTANATGVGCRNADVTANDGAVPFLQIDEGKWHAVSSPVHTSEQSYENTASVNGLTSDDYDMFGYDEATSTWQNQKAGNDATGFTTLARANGYIYRRGDDKVLHFSGEPNTAASYSVSLTRANNDSPLRLSQFLSAGVYILRLNGQSQKIVIR